MILAMLFAIPQYIHRSCDQPSKDLLEKEIAFLDDVSVTHGSKINDCKVPTTLPPESSDLSTEHPYVMWNNSPSMLIIHVITTIASMIAAATILKCSTWRRSNDKLDGDRDSSASVSVVAMEEQYYKEAKSEMVV